MKQLFFTSFTFLLIGHFLFAQNVGVGTSIPDVSAELDVTSTDKGVLIPRVNILDLTTAAPVSSPATSLLVYNTNATSGTGFYSWDGSQWIKLLDKNTLTIDNGLTANNNDIDLGGPLNQNTVISQGTNDMIYNLDGTGDFEVQENGNPLFHVEETGNVGIGTSNPSKKMVIANASGSEIIRFSDANSIGTDSDIFFRQGGVISAQGVLGLLADNDNTGGEHIVFAFGGEGVTTSTERVRITGAGNVGIGVSAPRNRLHLHEPTSSFNNIQFTNMTTGDANAMSGYRLGLGSDEMGYLIAGAGVNGIRIASDANLGDPAFHFDAITNYVGIGTVTPSDKLQVDGNVRIGTINPSGSGTIPGYGNRLLFSGGGAIAPRDSDNSDPMWIARYNVAVDETELRISIGDNFQAQDAVSIGYTGTVGWTEVFRFATNGGALKPGGGTWTALSDFRAKKEIKQFTDGLNVLKNINPVSFQYNGRYNSVNDGKEHVGIIAQEVQQVAPYMIGTYQAKASPESMVVEEVLNYDGGNTMIYVLINSVKEQQEMIEKQGALLKKQQEMIDRLILEGKE